ncbi:hypothetical protein [Bacillus sp. X1(2014)]|uniref:hypothetical protein n=1 Tax=Bacillus sp. X1(2014) TaxID=1565991 RepID=UPI00119E70A5|nr:hypothetical protein [Bacillus sp. X1(2014)]
MTVLYVYEPKLKNDTITYSWNFSEDPGIFKKNEFYIKYQEIDISKLDIKICLEIFVSLMIPILRTYNKEVTVILPHEIPEDTVNYWLSYNEASNIKVFPTVKSYVSSNFIKPLENKKIGILFGGGKDSLYAYKVNKELFGVENLLIISYVFPINYADIKRLDDRRDNFALNRLKEDGANIQKVYTNLRSIFAEYSYFNTIHTQLYFSMSYPLYIEHGLSYLTYSYEFTHYWNLDEDNKEMFYFKKSRAEFDSFLSEYLSKRLGSSFQIFNSNYYLSENLAFKILNDRYNALEELMMCEAVADPSIKWCMKCNKCGEFVLYSLANKHESNALDYNYFLSESDYINKTIINTEKYNNSRNNDGNVSWYDGLIIGLHYMSFCHMIHSIDLDFWSTKLEEKALTNLRKLKGWFGNKSYEVLDSYLLGGLLAINHPYEKDIINILNEHAPQIDSDVIEILFGNSKVKIDYRLTYPLHLEDKNRFNNQYLSNTIINKTRPGFHNCFEHEIKAYNIENKNEIDYFFQEDFRGYSMYINKSAPNKGDCVEVTYFLKGLLEKKSYEIQLALFSPYISNEYMNRFKYMVLLDNEQAIEEDISNWGNDNLINIYFNAKSKQHSLTIRIETLKNCEPWNWGKAAELVIKKVDIKSIPKMNTNHVAASSPYSKLNRIGAEVK